MEDSILNSVKLNVNVVPDDEAFDEILITHINMAFMTLTQIGAGPSTGFMITGPDEEWSDYSEDEVVINAIKAYIPAKVRLLFDPPQSSIVAEAYNKIISELEWRISVSVDPRKEIDNVNN